MKKIFLLIVSAITANSLFAQGVTYYVQADQDDWQLFMAQKVTADLADGKKVVFITLTAGDAGNGSSAYGGASVPYFSSRERGAIYSTKLVGDMINAPIPPFNNTYPLPTLGYASINGKNIAKYYFGNPSGPGALVNYFLRLPDGGPAGAGYAGTGNKSLKKLKEGTIPNMTSVDGANTYTWTELVNMITAIIFAESGTGTQAWLNTSNLNTALYPDISDHVFSSTAAQEAVASHWAIGINEFVMDYSSNSSANLSTEDYQIAIQLFGIYNWSLLRDRYSSQLNSTTRAWFPMELYTEKRAPVGVLPVALSDLTGTLKGNSILLEWTTSQEVNSKEFQVEKSYDGMLYQKIATIAASGNSTSAKKYNFLDKDVAELNYYRLNMVDQDGSFKRSNVVLVKYSGIVQDVFATTNPFRDYVGLRFAKAPKGELSYRLIDLSGKQVTSGKLYNPFSSMARINLNTVLSRGMYLLQVETEGKQYSIKLLKE
ncbi:MAG: T9SS type A sorting domain-containing protein [Chitinophagaceae bacterium]|nr:T9SS type A sorting domain-containing protein [Chitinophagaceae bacterium]